MRRHYAAGKSRSCHTLNRVYDWQRASRRDAPISELKMNPRGYPISPRHMILLSDPEVYKIASDDRKIVHLRKANEIVDLNLAQCFNASENFYFASFEKVQGTIKAFKKKKDALRLPTPELTEAEGITPEGNMGTLLSMPGRARRMFFRKQWSCAGLLAHQSL
jgi:hypothetical protein